MVVHLLIMLPFCGKLLCGYASWVHHLILDDLCPSVWSRDLGSVLLLSMGMGFSFVLLALVVTVMACFLLRWKIKKNLKTRGHGIDTIRRYGTATCILLCYFHN